MNDELTDLNDPRPKRNSSSSFMNEIIQIIRDPNEIHRLWNERND